MTEMNRKPTEEEPLIPAILGNMTLQTATRKAVSPFYIRIGKTGHKTSMEKYPNNNIHNWIERAASEMPIVL